MSISLKARLVALAALSALAVGALGALFVASNRRNETALGILYQQNVETLVRLQRIDRALVEVRFRAAAVLIDQMLITGSLNHLREVRTAVDVAWTEIDATLKEALHGDALEALAALEAAWPQVGQTLTNLERAYVAKNTAAIGDVLENDWPPLQAKVVKPLQALIPAMQDGAAEAYATAQRQGRESLRNGLIVAVLCSLGVLLTAWRTIVTILRPLAEVRTALTRIAQGDLVAPLPQRRSDEFAPMIGALGEMQHQLAALVGQLQATARHIEAASAEVAEGNRDLSNRTEHTAASLQETVATMAQFSASLRTGAEAATEADRQSSASMEVARRGGSLMSEVVSTMSDIQGSSRRIAEIIGVIDGIAFQTNILALNAAVEAARAGEQGRGFAVVATEVRTLAGRAAEAAREIRSLIETSVTRVQDGSRLVSEAGATVDRLVSTADEVTRRVGAIRAASQEQTDGIQQISSAVTQIDAATQQNAALVEQSSAAAQTLRDQAARLAELTQRFRVAVA